VAVAAGATVLFIRPLTPAIILWTAVLSLIVILLLEVLQRPPVEPAVPEATPPPASGAPEPRG